MMTPLYFCIVCGVLGLVLALITFFGSDGWSDWPFLTGVLAAVLVIVAIVIPSTIYGSRAINRTNCHNFAKQTGRITKFVVYNSWNQGECLTPTAGGKWIPTSSLREFGNKP